MARFLVSSMAIPTIRKPPTGDEKKWFGFVDEENIKRLLNNQLRLVLSQNTASIFVAYHVYSSLSTVVRSCVSFLLERLTTTVTVDSRDQAFFWLQAWLNAHPRMTNVQQLIASTHNIDNIHSLSPGHTPRIAFTPAYGWHMLTHRGRILVLRRRHAENTLANGTQPVETFTLTTLGRSRCTIESILADAYRTSQTLDNDLTVCYTGDQFGNWRKSRCRPKRPVDSVVLSPGLADTLIADARDFLSNEEWYLTRGIPYRRGYLFYGPPGSGKTSFVTALAGVLELHVYTINVSNSLTTDETLAELLACAPTRCIVLLEDVDYAFQRRDSSGAECDSDMKSGTQVTYSGLLNALDGVAAQEGRILIMTSNHADRLAANLIRPGRIDVRVLFDWATPQQMHQLFLRFYACSTDNSLHSLADAFVANLGLSSAHTDLVSRDDVTAPLLLSSPSRHISMANLQGFLMRFKDDPQGAVEHRTDLFGQLDE